MRPRPGIQRNFHLKHWAQMILRMLDKKYPQIKPENGNIEFTEDLHRVGNEMIIGIAKHRLKHLPRGLVEAAMSYAETKMLLRMNSILTVSELHAAERAEDD